jgi:hypothetical protein
MKISTKAQLAIREADLIMLGKAFRLFAVAFSKAAPDAVEPGLHAVMTSIAADLTDIAQKFPQGIAPDHPLAVFARSMQKLIAETRQDIEKAARPH